MQKNKLYTNYKASILIVMSLVLVSISTICFAFMLSHASSYIALSCFLKSKQQDNFLYSIEQTLQHAIRFYLESSHLKAEKALNLREYLKEIVNVFNQKQNLVESNYHFSLEIENIDPELKPIELFQTVSLPSNELEDFPLSLREWEGLKLPFQQGNSVLKLKLFSTKPSRDEEHTYRLKIRYYVVPIINYPLIQYGLPASGEVASKAGDWIKNKLSTKHYKYLTNIFLEKSYNFKYKNLEINEIQNSAPNYFRHTISVCGNVFEKIFKNDFEDFSEENFKNYITFDFCDLTRPRKEISGLTYYSQEVGAKKPTLVVNLDQLKSTVLIIADSTGEGKIVFKADKPTTPKCVFINNVNISNRFVPLTEVILDCVYPSKVLMFAFHCKLTSYLQPAVGAFLLNPDCVLQGDFKYVGHLSFYGPKVESNFKNAHVEVTLDENVCRELAAFSPQTVLLTSEWLH